MRKAFLRILMLSLFLFLTCMPFISAEEQRIYDQANLLTAEEIGELERQAAAYFDEWQTDFIVVTTEDTGGKDIQPYTTDFADDLADAFARREDNMAILAMDMASRDFYIAGFGAAEDHIDDRRISYIINEITPDLSAGNYFTAFETFFVMSDEYMDIRPGINPHSIFFNTIFQLGAALALGAVVVFLMAFNAGGKVTVNSGTYLDAASTRVNARRDRYLRKTVTRRKKPSNNNNKSGGFGGGGISGGGRSHSGGRGSF